MSDAARYSDPLFSLLGKTVLVTGAASGLGKAIAIALSERGCRLVLCDLNESGLDGTRRLLSGEVHLCRADVTNENEVRALMGEANAFGGLYGVVNSAGLFNFGPALDLDIGDFDRVLAVNVKGAFLLSKEAARIMKGRGGGRIVHLASVSSLVANVNYVAYATSKAAVAQMVRVLAREWAPDGILVNAIGPALIETNLSSNYLADGAFRASSLSVIPLGRFGLTDDLIGAVVLLLAQAGSFITGQTIYVDGGRTLV